MKILPKQGAAGSEHLDLSFEMLLQHILIAELPILA
jgi:hypothetical protein